MTDFLLRLALLQGVSATPFRRPRSLLLAVAVVLATPLLARAAEDPVAELRQALLTRPLGDPFTVTEKQQAEIKKFYAEREQQIAKIIDTKLKTFPQLRQALMLRDWGDIIKTGPQDPLVTAADVKLRARIAQKFRAMARRVVETGNDESKAALATMLTEMGLTIRAAVDTQEPGRIDNVEAEQRGGFARSLTPEIIKLCHSRSEFVRLHALRALAGINANPAVAAKEFADEIRTNPDVKARRVAADGYLRLVGIASYLRDQHLRTSEVWAMEHDVIRAAQQVAQHAPAALGDVDALVRLRGADALRVSAQALADLFKKAPEDPKLKPLAPRTDFAPADVQAVKETLKAFQQAGPALAKTLEDSDAGVRLASVRTLERLSEARYRLTEEPITVGAVGKAQDRIRLVPPLANDPLELFAKGAWRSAARLLQDPNAQVRLAAVKFLEFFPEARPAVVPELTRALSDTNPFVRWAAARALGVFSKNYQPKDAVGAVPALGKMLFDPDYTDRLAAAATLEALGPYAEAAVPELARAVHYGDTENRVAALYVIQSIGAKRSQTLIPYVAEALSQPDPRVRRAAAETLGSYGSLARIPATLAALRRALGDEDQEVRLNASEAILQILSNE